MMHVRFAMLWIAAGRIKLEIGGFVGVYERRGIVSSSGGAWQAHCTVSRWRSKARKSCCCCHLVTKNFHFALMAMWEKQPTWSQYLAFDCALIFHAHCYFCLSDITTRKSHHRALIHTDTFMLVMNFIWKALSTQNKWFTEQDKPVHQCKNKNNTNIEMKTTHR